MKMANFSGKSHITYVSLARPTATSFLPDDSPAGHVLRAVALSSLNTDIWDKKCILRWSFLVQGQGVDPQSRTDALVESLLESFGAKDEYDIFVQPSGHLRRIDISTFFSALFFAGGPCLYGILDCRLDPEMHRRLKPKLPGIVHNQWGPFVEHGKYGPDLRLCAATTGYATFFDPFHRAGAHIVIRHFRGTAYYVTWPRTMKNLRWLEDTGHAIAIATANIPGLFTGQLMEGASMRKVDEPCGFILPPTHIAAVIAKDSPGFLVEYQYSLRDCGTCQALQETVLACSGLAASEAGSLLEYVEGVLKELRSRRGDLPQYIELDKSITKERAVRKA
jgi:hypothetical protein